MGGPPTRTPINIPLRCHPHPQGQPGTGRCGSSRRTPEPVPQRHRRADPPKVPRRHQIRPRHPSNQIPAYRAGQPCRCLQQQSATRINPATAATADCNAGIGMHPAAQGHLETTPGKNLHISRAAPTSSPFGLKLYIPPIINNTSPLYAKQQDIRLRSCNHCPANHRQ